jgi:hypothetical protein
MRQDLKTSQPPPQLSTTRPPTCSETRMREMIRITCRSYSSEKRHTTMLVDRVLRMAAESTLAAGGTHFSSLGIEILQIQTTEPTCHEERERNFGAALASGMIAYSDSMAGRPVRNPPPPRYKTVCEGGGELQWIDSAESFEVLDADQAAARSDPLIPIGKRPIEARAVLAPRNANQVPLTGGPIR